MHIMQLVGPVLEGKKGSVDVTLFSGPGRGGGGVGGGGRALLPKNVSKQVGRKYLGHKRVIGLSSIALCRVQIFHVCSFKIGICIPHHVLVRI